MIGEVLGGYVVERKLGEGGMGEVFLATHRRISRRAAVKVLHPEFSREPEILNRFFNEARATSVIEHPNIVQVHDCDFHASGRAFIVMEYLRGETLASALRRVGNLRDDLGAIFQLMRQMASALEAAHAKGIVHRDLKPDNIFLVKGGYGASGMVVKVLDFGIAKLASGVGSGSSNTRTGSLLGTPLYMSPEQCRGAPQVDHRADIYSLGCVLFELLSGRPPFQREGAGDLIVAHVTEQPPLLASLGVDVPAELEDLVQQMLAKSPADRPSSMADVRAALEALEARTGVRAGRLTVVEPADPSSTLPLPGGMTPPAMTPPPGPPTPAAVTPAGMVGGTAFLPTPQPGSADRDRAGAGSRTPRPKSSSGQGTTPIAHHGQVETGRRGRSLQGRRREAERRVPAIAWALGAVILAGGVVGAVVWRGGGSAHDAVSREATAPKAEMPVVAAPAVPLTAEPQRVTIDVESGPPQMTVSVDGLATTFPLTFPRDGRPHELVFRAPGHRELRRVIEATRDQSLVIAMERAEPERPAPDHPASDEGAVRAAGSRETSRSHSSRAAAAAATAKPEKTQPKPTGPARRLPAVITDID